MKSIKKITIISASLALMLMFGVFACSGDGKDTNGDANTSDSDVKIEDPKWVEHINLEPYKGKMVLLNFWATWCKPCLKEMPDLVKLQNEYKDNLAIVGATIINPRKPEEESSAKKITSEQKLIYDVVLVKLEDLQSFKLSGVMPESILYDKEGNEIFRWKGGKDYNFFKQTVEKYLNE